MACNSLYEILKGMMSDSYNLSEFSSLRYFAGIIVIVSEWIYVTKGNKKLLGHEEEVKIITSRKDRMNKNVLRRRRKMGRLSDGVKSADKLFHTVEPATANALVPTVARRTGGTSK
jgi:hypothetical protein